MTPRTVADPGGPTGIRVAPDGRYAYITNAKLCIVPKGSKCASATNVRADTVSVFRISPGTGALSAKPVETVATGHNPQMITIAPDGKNLYVITVGDNTIAQYRINPATGALSAKPASTAATVLHPEAIALAPGGNNAYVTSENKGVLSQFAISPATGKITPLSPATVTIPPSGSLGVAVTPAK